MSAFKTDIKIDAASVISAFSKLDTMHLLLFIILILIIIILVASARNNSFLKKRLVELNKERDELFLKLIKKKIGNGHDKNSTTNKK